MSKYVNMGLKSFLLYFLENPPPLLLKNAQNMNTTFILLTQKLKKLAAKQGPVFFGPPI